MKSFYVTTPIYYANSSPHLGSLYTTIIADCLARYHRQLGVPTYFLTGTDEHGINIERVAAEKGVTPQEHVDNVAKEFQESFADFGLDTAHGGYDVFMRTSAPFHYRGVAELWRRVRNSKTPKGREPLYKGKYEGWFCAKCAAYKTEEEAIFPEQKDSPPICPDHLTPLERWICNILLNFIILTSPAIDYIVTTFITIFESRYICNGLFARLPYNNDYIMSLLLTEFDTLN